MTWTRGKTLPDRGTAGTLRLYYSTLDGCHVYGNGGTNNNGNPLRMDHHVPLNDGRKQLRRVNQPVRLRLSQPTQERHRTVIHEGAFRRTIYTREFSGRRFFMTVGATVK